MLISLRSDHKEHLQLLTTLSEQVIADFCKLASDFIQNGPNTKMYTTAAKKLQVDVDIIQNCVYGLINLLLLACKHQLNEADFRDSVLTLGFSNEQEAIISKFFDSERTEIDKLNVSALDDQHYHDLQWRFEVQLASRSLLQQVTPLVIMDLTLRTHKDKNSEPDLHHKLLQTDPTNLLHLANELESALTESRNRHSRKIQRTLQNLQL